GAGAHHGKKPSSFPVTLKSKATLSIPFDVGFACANDPLKGAGHEDYSFTARVDHTAIRGGDAHVLDDVCPRSVPAGGLTDPFPDGKLVDQGCGTKKPEKPFGARVLRDVPSKWGPIAGFAGREIMGTVRLYLVLAPLIGAALLGSATAGTGGSSVEADPHAGGPTV